MYFLVGVYRHDKIKVTMITVEKNPLFCYAVILFQDNNYKNFIIL